MAEQTRNPTRDYKSLSRTPWRLWEVLYERKSCRKYKEESLSEDFIERLEDTIDISTRVRAARQGSVRAYTEGRLVDTIRAGIFKGAVGKINIWLMRTRPSGFLLIDVLKEDMDSDRPEALPVAAIVAEDTVLWLAEQGLGSCWMAGVNQKELSRIAGAGADSTIPVAISFGTPFKKAKPGYDSLMQVMQTKRRKPLSKIAFHETMDSPYLPEDVKPAGFAAPDIQDVRGLLEMTGAGTGGWTGSPSPELVFDACFEAGRIAPSGGNFQPWSFIGIKDRTRLDELEKACGTKDWELAILVAASVPKLTTILVDRPFWMLDGPIALSHISLMAASMGMAPAVFVNGIDEKAAGKAVKISGGFRVVGVVGLR